MIRNVLLHNEPEPPIPRLIRCVLYNHEYFYAITFFAVQFDPCVLGVYKRFVTPCFVTLCTVLPDNIFPASPICTIDMDDFCALGLSDTLIDTLSACGIDRPTKIQAKAIPSMLMGRDILASAKTGSGKTASYALPMLDMLNERRGRAKMPRAIVLSPTRELAAQVFDNFARLGHGMTLNVLLLIGGIKMGEQERQLTRGVDVLIATPGRLLDHVQRGKILLSGVEILVIDEVDRMLDIGFIDNIDRLVKMLPPRQTLMLSATMPKEMETLANRYLNNPKRIIADSPSQVSTTIDHSLCHLSSSAQKIHALVTLLQKPEVNGGIIFCNRKRDVDTVQRYLAKQKFSVSMLHGDMDQYQRLSCLQAFRDGEVAYLVCSDVAARGLDIPSVDYVFNFDVPSNAEDYVHRIGRTGRAGRKGTAITLATAEDEKLLLAIEHMIGDSITLHADSIAPQAKEPVQGRVKPKGRAKKVLDPHSTNDASPDKNDRREAQDSKRQKSAQTTREQDHDAEENHYQRPLRDNEHVPRFLLR